MELLNYSKHNPIVATVSSGANQRKKINNTCHNHFIVVKHRRGHCSLGYPNPSEFIRQHFLAEFVCLICPELRD